MIMNHPDRAHELNQALNELCAKDPLHFKDILPNDLPERPGVYLITRVEEEFEIPYWIGRADNIKSRVFTGLLMGGYANASFKRELQEKHICASIEEAKQFIREHCALRWLRIADLRFRDLVASYAAALLDPKCGLPKEP